MSIIAKQEHCLRPNCKGVNFEKLVHQHSNHLQPISTNSRVWKHPTKKNSHNHWSPEVRVTLTSEKGLNHVAQVGECPRYFCWRTTPRGTWCVASPKRSHKHPRLAQRCHSILGPEMKLDPRFGQAYGSWRLILNLLIHNRLLFHEDDRLLITFFPPKFHSR